MKNTKNFKLVVDTLTKTYYSNLRSGTDEEIKEFRSFFEQIKSLKYLKIECENDTIYIHPDKIVAISIRIVE